MRQELDALVPRQFLKHVPFERLIHITRYLKALLIRAERAALSPAKDAEKVKRVQPYVDALRQYVARPQLTEDARQQLHEFRWLIEEYKVSCFAQELGTAEPVSPRRLEDKLKRLAEMIPGNKQ
jgi:ATP-dependent helicase HrpA